MSLIDGTGWNLNEKMRPTTGKVVLALFNILGPLKGKSFLDLFRYQDR